MQRSCHSTQWDPIGFNIDQYKDFKIVKDVSYIKIANKIGSPQVLIRIYSD
jgi:hypothetical protein